MNQIILAQLCLVLVLSTGALVLLICVGFILYQSYKLFILLSDIIGYWLLKIWRTFK